LASDSFQVPVSSLFAKLLFALSNIQPPKIPLDFFNKAEVTYKQRIFDILSQKLIPFYQS